jgi:hypothetical protein
MSKNKKKENQMTEQEKNRQTLADWLVERDEDDEYWAEDENDSQQPSVLEEAEAIIYGDRENTYGHPSKNLETIAQFWTSYVNAATNDALGGMEFTPEDVALMMILVKTARLANTPNHRDSIVDICGYAALIERCEK